MSSITLSASVRQNLLSLQSTAELLSTTQGRLSSGNKVNSALDNPTNFFTAQSLNSRASDINNLLDGIGNGVQIIQAANTGITSLQKLVDSAKSIANQALQTTVGYTKSSATGAANKGITANDLLGTTAAVTSSVTGSQLANNVSAIFGNAIVANASAVHSDTTTVVSAATTSSSAALVATDNADTVFTGSALTTTSGATVTGATTLTSSATSSATKINLAALDGKTIKINDIDITFDSTPAAAGITGDATTGFTVDISANSAVTLNRLLETFDTAMGNTDAAHKSSVVGGAIVLHTGDGTKNVDFSGTLTADLNALGLGTAVSTSGPLALTNAVGAPTGTVFTGGVVNNQLTVPVPITASTTLGGATNTDSIDLTALAGQSLTINGVALNFVGTAGAGITGDNATGYTIGVSNTSSATVGQLLDTIDAAMGNSHATDVSVINGGAIEIHTGNAASVSISKSSGFTTGMLTSLGLNALEDAGGAPVAITNTPSALTLNYAAGPTSTISANSLLSDIGLVDGQSITINNQTITIGSAASTAPSATGNNINIGSGTVQDLLNAINGIFGNAAGHGVASFGTGTDAGKIMLNGGTANATMVVGGTTAALTSLGLAPNTFNRVEGPATVAPPITGSTKLAGATASPTSNALANDIVKGEKITVNGKTIEFYDSGSTGSNIAAGSDVDTTYLDLATATVDDVLGAIDDITGATGASASNVSAAAATAGKINLSTGTTEDLVLGDVAVGAGAAGSVLAKLGLVGGTTARVATPATAPAITGATKLSGEVGEDSLKTSFAVGDKITVNGTEISFVASGATGNDVNITDSIDALLAKIDAISGGTGSKVVNGKVQLNAGDATDLVISDNGVGPLAGSILKKIGLEAGTTKKSSPIDPGLTGKTLTIGATGGAKEPITITFGTDDALGQVSTLDELNKKLAANNLQASISTTGAITLTTTNDAASADIGALGGTATDPGGIFSGVDVKAAVKDPNSQATRASLVAQYNQVIDQIKTTAADSSFNGVNLLSGDTLSLTFNETGTSKLDITGVNFGPEGLGLSSLLSGTDFLDNASANKILTGLNDASTKLRSQASSFGSNLSVVQIRQNFAKNLINVLQTGASNLTLADTNEEAANSQALSTRQSIAVSSLALANQSQQGVLQLLR